MLFKSPDCMSHWVILAPGASGRWPRVQTLGKRSVWSLLGMSLLMVSPSQAAPLRSPKASRPTHQSASKVSDEVGSSVRINEVVAQPTGGTQDWIELYNAGPDEISLSGWVLKDSLDGQPHPDHQWTLPPGLTILPGTWLLLTSDKELGFPFGLGAQDGVYLYDGAGSLVDSTLWQEGQASEGTAWGRFPNGSGPFQTLSPPTPGLANLAGGTPLQDPSEHLYDGQVRTYNLSVDPEDWQWLQANPTLELYVPATLHFEGGDYGLAGLRYKGSTGSLYGCFDDAGNQLCDKLAMKLAFDAYDDNERFFGQRKLQFHAMENDPSKLHERMGYNLFLEFGVAAPRTTYNRLVINDVLQGAYILVEQIDGRFTRYHFPDGGEGNLYKESWPKSTDPQTYLNALVTNEDDNPDVSVMVNFAQEIAVTDASVATDMLARYQDLPTMMRYLAVDRAIENQDGIMAWYCWGPYCINHNFYWYQDTDSNRLWLVPWDLDHAFATETWFEYLSPGFPEWNEKPESCRPVRIYPGIGALPPSCDPLIHDWATATWNLYVSTMNELLNGLYSEASLNARVDRYVAEAHDLIAEDPKLDVTEWDAAVAQYRQDLLVLREQMLEQIGQ